MGWKVNPSAKLPYDLDASTFLLRANGEIGVEEDFVFYGSCKTIDTPEGKRPISNDGSLLGSVAVGTPYDDGLEPICRKYASKFM